MIQGRTFLLSIRCKRDRHTDALEMSHETSFDCDRRGRRSGCGCLHRTGERTRRRRWWWTRRRWCVARRRRRFPRRRWWWLPRWRWRHSAAVASAAAAHGLPQRQWRATFRSGGAFRSGQSAQFRSNPGVQFRGAPFRGNARFAHRTFRGRSFGFVGAPFYAYGYPGAMAIMTTAATRPKPSGTDMSTSMCKSTSATIDRSARTTA